MESLASGRRSLPTQEKIFIRWKMGSLLIDAGDIVLAFFPFGDSPGRKMRPVLALTAPIGPVPELIVAYISSVMPSSFLPSDLVADPALADFATTNLKKLSVMRLHKIASIHESS